MMTGTIFLAGPRISATGSLFDSTKKLYSSPTLTLSRASMPKILEAAEILKVKVRDDVKLIKILIWSHLANKWWSRYVLSIKSQFNSVVLCISGCERDGISMLTWNQMKIYVEN